jgi:hypothetical protein
MAIYTKCHENDHTFSLSNLLLEMYPKEEVQQNHIYTYIYIYIYNIYIIFMYKLYEKEWEYEQLFKYSVS